MTDSRKRQDLIDAYNKDSKFFCFLLTTQTGGVGITLTGADRVIIFDPAWNPASDNQAVDRAFRIGQMKNVVVYRFISCGTIEEKIYRKQVYKDTISKTATKKDSNQYRYFTRDELAALMTLDDPYQSETQKHLAAIHTKRNTYPELEEHLKVLKSFGIFGTSDHDLLFNESLSAETFDHIDTNAIQREVDESASRVFSESRSNPSQRQINSIPNVTGKVKIPPKQDVSRLTADEFKHLIMGVRLFGDQNWKKVLESFPFVQRNAMFLKGEWDKIKKNCHYTQLDAVLRSYDKVLFPNGNCPPIPKLQRDVICIDDEPNQIIKNILKPTAIEIKPSQTVVEKVTEKPSPQNNTNATINIDSISPIKSNNHSSRNDISLNDSVFSELRDASILIDSDDEDDIEDDIEYDASLSPETILKQMPDPNKKESMDQVAKRLSICMGISTPQKNLIKKSKRNVMLSDSEDEEDDEDIDEVCENIGNFEINKKSYDEKEYQRLIEEGKNQELKGNELGALDFYMQAFTISSHDENLEYRIYKIGERNNLMV